MLYDLIILFASFLGRVFSIFDKKAKKFFLLRKGEINRIEKFFRGVDGSKVIWFHSASAGEFEQAKPIIESLRKIKSNIKITASFFSPSGYEAGIKYNEVDFCFNLPLDYRKNIYRLLNCINPDIIIYSKYDVWPNLTILSDKKGIKSILISGTLPEKSLRHKFPFLIFFRRIYRLLNRIYAISDMDARRFLKIIGRKNKANVYISGDTRFDRIKNVIEEKPGYANRLIKKDKSSVYIIAGSTHEVSEKKLLNAAKRLKNEDNNIRFIIVPHEINPENINRINKLIRSKDFTPVTYSNSDLPISVKDNEILVVDTAGILAYLYDIADIAFVGGSYKGSVHSVLEPAAFGKPILTGPFINNAFEAIRLKKIGGLNLCDSEDNLYKMIKRLASEEKYRATVSKSALEFFNEGLGASRFIINDLKSLLS